MAINVAISSINMVIIHQITLCFYGNFFRNVLSYFYMQLGQGLFSIDLFLFIHYSLLQKRSAEMVYNKQV